MKWPVKCSFSKSVQDQASAKVTAKSLSLMEAGSNPVNPTAAQLKSVVGDSDGHLIQKASISELSKIL